MCHLAHFRPQFLPESTAIRAILARHTEDHAPTLPPSPSAVIPQKQYWLPKGEK